MEEFETPTEMKLNDIFGLEKWRIYRDFSEKNGYTITEIEPLSDENNVYIRQFQVVEKEKFEPTYANKRAAEYPSIAEQMDMLYWDKVNGTNLWQESIAQIKNKYPKES